MKKLLLVLALMASSCITTEVTLEQKARYHVDLTSAGMIKVDTWTGRTEVYTESGWKELSGFQITEPRKDERVSED